MIAVVVRTGKQTDTSSSAGWSRPSYCTETRSRQIWRRGSGGGPGCASGGSACRSAAPINRAVSVAAGRACRTWAVWFSALDSMGMSLAAISTRTINSATGVCSTARPT